METFFGEGECRFQQLLLTSLEVELMETPLLFEEHNQRTNF